MPEDLTNGQLLFDKRLALGIFLTLVIGLTMGVFLSDKMPWSTHDQLALVQEKQAQDEQNLGQARIDIQTLRSSLDNQTTANYNDRMTLEREMSDIKSGIAEINGRLDRQFGSKERR